jgi:pseudouridine-5'-phosphate glycosidase
MAAGPALDIRPQVVAALQARQPVVALESTLIAQGLPWPANLETARAAEAAIREESVVPATIAVWRGRPTVGLTDGELEWLASHPETPKATRRDLAAAVVRRQTAATTVAATIAIAHWAGIRVFATGGIGGAHRGAGDSWDVSADLMELARTPVVVVCAGAKSILDIPGTLEILETHGVLVVGYGTDEFPAFYLRSSGEPVAARVDSPEEAAAMLEAHWAMEGAGVVLALPIDAALALEPGGFQAALNAAERQALEAGVRGPALTPFLLQRLAEATEGQSVRANKALVVANARLAARVARALAKETG